MGFANSVPLGQDGILFIGVDNAGTPRGISDLDSLQKTVRKAANECYPPVKIGQQAFDVGGKAVLAVVVPGSPKRPHFAGAAYLRVGSETVEASEQLYEELLLSRNDKAAYILARKSEVWTVVGLGRKIGDPQQLESIYREQAEFQIADCNAHFVRLRRLASSTSLTEALEDITISYDERAHRPMLIARAR